MPSEINQYDFKEKIGNGNFGEVWLVKNAKTGKRFVLKKLNLSGCSQLEKQRAVLESQLLATLQHPNIVMYHASFFHTDHKSLNIVMGYCEGGDLYEHLRKQNGRVIEEDQIVEWLIQICMALQYLHEKHILHRDLKTRNIFLTRKGLIKLGDFGIARVLDGTSDMAGTLIGTPYYMSPEILTGKMYNHKSDIWSLGCCVYEMASLKHAFRARDFNSLMFKVLHGKPPVIPKHYSGELSSLTSAMLNSDPEERPSVHSLLEHPFIHKHIIKFLENTKDRSTSASAPINGNIHFKNDQNSINQPPQIKTSTENHEYIPNSNHHHQIARIPKTISSILAVSERSEILTDLKCNGRTYSVAKLCVSKETETDVVVRTTEEKDSSSDKSLDKARTTQAMSEEKESYSVEPKSKYCATAARARRRWLQSSSSHTHSLDSLDHNDESNKSSKSNEIQRPRSSARQRRRERQQNTTDDEQNGNFKCRPKSAPSGHKTTISCY